ncbi:hypothetical protein TRIUR3_28973 [Triticum urartu]|uniref:Uncharacterized protein n=1 Tax=Triticum urartu TaxID=4572 RepID=M7ZZI3_TRIUA|nr:hypothetical protein TRIUR3_28973 [Triticum urartu]
MVVLFFRSRLRQSVPVPLSNTSSSGRSSLASSSPSLADAKLWPRTKLMLQPPLLLFVRRLTRQTARSPPLLRACGHRSHSPAAALLHVLPSPRTLPVTGAPRSSARPWAFWSRMPPAHIVVSTKSTEGHPYNNYQVPLRFVYDRQAPRRQVHDYADCAKYHDVETPQVRLHKNAKYPYARRCQDRFGIHQVPLPMA